MTKGFVFRLLLLLLPLASLQAAEPFSVHNVSGGLNQPWGLALVDQQWGLVTEKPGNLVLVNLMTGDKQRIYGAPIAKQVGQGGLLDIELAPDFQQSRWVYFSYSKSVPGGVTTALARARWTGGLQLSELEELLVTNAVRSSSRHFGSRLAFDQHGYLYMTIGDRGHRKFAQDLSQHAGKVLRLNADGSVPQDNPFLELVKAGRKDVMPEIYTYGHRNPQGLAFDPVSQRMWLHEHGPRGGDEVNILKPGANYGWPLQTFGREYSGLAIKNAPPEDTVMPKWHWTPSIAPSGLAVYRGDAFPQWRGDLLVGALVGLGMVHLETTQEQIEEEQRFFEVFGQRIRTIEVGKNGEIYLLTDRSDGQLLRLDPVARARSSSFRESVGRQ